MPEKISIALLGSGILREGLQRILSENNFTITLSTKSVEDLWPRNNGEIVPYKILLLDESIVKAEADIYHRLRNDMPDVSLVVLADIFDFELMVNAFRNGISGYIIKDISPKPLIESLRLVALGEKVMPSEMAMFLGTRSYPAGWSRQLASVNLSEREIQVLQLLIMGAANKVIGRELGICEATVKVHVKAALRKLQVSNRTQAAIWAVQHGLIGYDADGFEAMLQQPSSPMAQIAC